MLSKVPEVTVWFWVIKILCTTVGESFADWINMTLGFGLVTTALIFTVVLVGVLWWQLSLKRYVPFAYWLTVVVVSVTGTLYTDILTDCLGGPTRAEYQRVRSASGCRVRRVVRPRADIVDSQHRDDAARIVLLARNSGTFALGTAAGDWILELTGWGPGTSVLLPAGLIVAIVLGWRLGANAVLSFWLAYILTRPLGANLGDWLGFPPDQQGLGLGVALTSVIFLTAILATVYLTITRADVIEKADDHPATAIVNPVRENVMLGTTRSLPSSPVRRADVGRGSAPHHRGGERDRIEPAVAVTLPPGQSATANFPPRGGRQVPHHRSMTHSRPVQAGDQGGAAARIKDLETAWDEGQSTLQPLNDVGWTVLDGQIDSALAAARADQTRFSDGEADAHAVSQARKPPSRQS